MITQKLTGLGGAIVNKENGFISRLTGLGLKAKIMGLLAILVFTSLMAILFLEYQVLNGRSAIISQKTDLDELYLMQDATATFSDVKYWYTEIAVSLSEEAAAASEESAELFKEKIKQIKSLDDVSRANILKDLEGLMAEAEEAMMSYTFEENEAGKKSMSMVRAYIGSINNELVKLMDGARIRAEQAVVVVEDTSSFALIGGLFMLVLVLIVGAGLIVAMNSMILIPLVRITDEMKRLAEGDTDIKLVDAGKVDEVGDMARAVQIFCKNTLKIETMNLEQKQVQQDREAERKVEEVAKQASENQQRQEIEAQLERQRMQAEAIKTLLQKKVHATLAIVVGSAETLEVSAVSLSQTVEQSSSEASLLSNSIAQTSSETHSLAAATEELSASINEINRQADESNSMSQKAVVMQEKANEAVMELADMSGRISDILGLINEIAEKTHLLALNATIEAARAGDAGRGFAVVASEVKDLAQQTGKATEGIQTQIKNIQVATQETVGTITGSKDSINSIAESSSTIVEAVVQQRGATEEISSSIQQVAMGTDSITDGIQRITDGISNTDAASSRVREVSNDILSVVSELSNEVDDFMATLSNG